MNKRLLGLVIFFSIAVFMFGFKTTLQASQFLPAYPGENEVQLTPDEIRSFLTSGPLQQTYDGKKKGKIRKKIFHANGVIENIGKANKGVWTVSDKGVFCQNWRRSTCGSVSRNGNIYNWIRGGKRMATFTHIK